MSTNNLQFLDMLQAESQQRQRIGDRIYAILQLVDGDKTKVSNLPPELQDEYKNLTGLLRRRFLDPVFEALYSDMKRNGQNPTESPAVAIKPGPAPRLKAGPPISSIDLAGTYPNDTFLTTKKDDAMLVALYGILTRDSHTDPGWPLDQGAPNPNLPAVTPAFANALAAARGEFTANRDLYENVLPALVGEATVGPVENGLGKEVLDSAKKQLRDAAGNIITSAKLRAAQWARVVYSLVQQNVRADDPLLTLKAQSALASAAGANDGAPPSSIVIDLPDLEQMADVEIQVANLEAMQAIYFAAMLEELKIFNVTEKLVELFQLGMLPLGRGRAGDFLYNYWRQSVTRMTEVERRNLYAR